jgi:hypothetical protein
MSGVTVLGRPTVVRPQLWVRRGVGQSPRKYASCRDLPIKQEASNFHPVHHPGETYVFTATWDTNRGLVLQRSSLTR